MSACLDASVLLAILLHEPASERVDVFIESRDGRLTVSEFAAAEVASGLSRRARTGAITPHAARDHLSDFDAWRATATLDVAIHEADVRLASIFVRRFELALRTPDALHAAICQRAGLALITLDLRLAEAGRSLGLEAHVP